MADPLELILEQASARGEPTDPPEALMGLVRARRQDTVIRTTMLASIVLAPILAIALTLTASRPAPDSPQPGADAIAGVPDNLGPDDLGPVEDGPDDPSRHTVIALRDRDPSLDRDDFPIARTPRGAGRDVERPMSRSQIERVLSGRE